MGKNRGIFLAMTAALAIIAGLQGCAPHQSALEATPTIAAAESPAPVTATGPVRQSASPEGTTRPRNNAAQAATPTLSPLMGAFAAVNNFIEDNGAGEAVGAVISPEKIQIALVDYYMETLPDLGERDAYDRVLNIFEALPYKEGALVLAQRQQDGESGPSLHYIVEGRVEKVSGEGVWWINYTHLEGEYIFYGLTAMQPLPGDAAFIHQDHAGALRRYPLRDGKWFIAPAGAAFPADLYFVDELGQRVSGEETGAMAGVFYSPDKEILLQSLMYHPALSRDEGYDSLALQTGETGGGDVMLMVERAAAGETFTVPPAVAWRGAATVYGVYTPKSAPVIEKPENLLAVYLVNLREDDGKESGQDLLQPQDLADIRKKGGQLSLPESPGEYAFIVDVTQGKDMLRYGLPFRLES